MDGNETRPLLLGEAPSRGGDRYHMLPLSGPPARVICLQAGIPPQEGGTTYGRWTWALYDRFECANVFERYRDATPWSAPRARERVASVSDTLRDRVVVCLGRRPQAAVYGGLGLGDPPDFYEWTFVAGPFLRLAVATIPHPSGLNRQLNDADERARSGETLRFALGLAARRQTSALAS